MISACHDARRCSSPTQVVLRKERDGEWVAIESAIRVLALLNEVGGILRGSHMIFPAASVSIGLPERTVCHEAKRLGASAHWLQ